MLPLKNQAYASIKAWGLKPLAAKVRARRSHALTGMAITSKEKETSKYSRLGWKIIKCRQQGAADDTTDPTSKQ